MEKPPIFIIGCPRSGTTLIRVILDSHPNICCGPETHIIKKLEKFNTEILNNWKMIKPYGLEQKDFIKNTRNFFEIFQKNYMKNKNKKRWAEKTPDNIFHVDFIDKLFPDCQFINIIRDGRDVVCSFKERWGKKTILYAIKSWNKSIDLTFEYQKRFDKKRYLEVRYEEMVSNPEKETRRIMDFLNEEWVPDLLEHHKKKHDFWFNVKTGENVNKTTEKKPERHSPSKPIFGSSVRKWEKNLNFLEKTIVNIMIKENLKKLGYK